MKKYFKQLRDDSSGATAIEYALLCLIGVMIIGAVGQIATSLQDDHYTPIAEAIGGARDGL
jgi:Flp pilus assembly pilin Flp